MAEGWGEASDWQLSNLLPNRTLKTTFVNGSFTSTPYVILQ